ncbi:hypothetical protein LRR18_16405 [Mangrovimonas sp. AS39]|uniref:hypothetical protein n=1 Tax=Mangrovimonas futianensis TaxID=2895523 RepID=UPI001E55DBFF|nr:hypothetical protein [Mangrovimonas futianensis]MCF1193172.1 hypothetical protein [Mangrovimonas futianensis]
MTKTDLTPVRTFVARCYLAGVQKQMSWGPVAQAFGVSTATLAAVRANASRRQYLMTPSRKR